MQLTLNVSGDCGPASLCQPEGLHVPGVLSDEGGGMGGRGHLPPPLLPPPHRAICEGVAAPNLHGGITEQRLLNIT